MICYENFLKNSFKIVLIIKINVLTLHSVFGIG